MIKSNLKILLAKRNLKITKVSNDTGISRTTLTSLASNYAKGIQFDTLENLCNYLKISPNDLFTTDMERREGETMEITKKILELLQTNLYNIDFKSGNKLVKCEIEILKDMLLVTDGMGNKYLVDSGSIEKISAFKEYTDGLSLPRTRNPSGTIK